jgi:quercetin dioxygenase-like cupin family protein
MAMEFYRFEQLQTHRFNPHLSSTQGPIIEGQHMFFRRVTKGAGSESRLHYHPNEFMAFLLEGEFDAIIGDERRRVRPGTLVHIPSNAQHSFTATAAGDLKYLYLKDRTWTMIGAAADEALPEKALTVTEVAQAHSAGRYPGQNRDPAASQAITGGFGNCYFPMTEKFDGGAVSGHHEQWVEGVNLAFGYLESRGGYAAEEASARHELFIYLLSGAMTAQVNGEDRRVENGDVIHVTRGSAYRWSVPGKSTARYTIARSTPRLETAIANNGASDNWRG